MFYANKILELIRSKRISSIGEIKLGLTQSIKKFAKDSRYIFLVHTDWFCCFQFDFILLRR